MRPIALTMKGINSFSEEQTIDFARLTSEGLFGIFGPTGSGKSTILDGITLALYGEIARKSKNFIHAGSDSASVSFTFSITEKETRTYRVFRTFKVKKDTGYSVAAKARLCELMGAGGTQEAQEIVLEDSISGVKERIRKIIGLEFEDFSRTVVLPQGKFSEFLKLSGSDRNQMLERLFNLYEYGIALTEKVKRKSEETELAYRTCIGKLAEHTGESEEALRALEKVLDEAVKERKELLARQKSAVQRYENCKAVWELWKELEEKEAKFAELEKKKPEMERTASAIQNAGKAMIVKPYELQQERFRSEYEQSKTAAGNTERQLFKEKEQLAETEQEFSRISGQKEACEKEYQEKIGKLASACDMEKQASSYIRKQQELTKQKKEQEEKTKSMNEKAAGLEASYAGQKAKLAEWEAAYLGQMEEVVLVKFREVMQKEGRCPVCGKAWNDDHTEAEEPGQNRQSSAGDAPILFQQIEEGKRVLAGLEAQLSEARSRQLEQKTAYAALEASCASAEESAKQYQKELRVLYAECRIGGNPQIHKKELEEAYQYILKEYEQCDRKLKQRRESLKEQELNNAKVQTRAEEQRKKLEEAEALLCQKLEECGFEQLEQMQAAYLPAAEIQRMDQELKAYEDRRIQTAHQIEVFKAKAGDKKVGRAEYELLLHEKEEADKMLNACVEQIAVYTERVQKMKEALAVLAGLLEEQKQLEHRKAVLAELSSLLKGKKFVEYVARERLSYVAGEASLQLQEITGGIYGLELTDSGDFMIRDYKNGGIVRNVNSLSGGELFLVSLSLALALSTQIQLKGTAPLEFFFLDEGFGTLDEELLDTVMNSLDRLHHDRRKIGIISHVDALKERVPVKLMVTPAKAGEGGSRVKIVR